MKVKLVFTVIASLIYMGGAFAQIPVELFTGAKKTSFDLMFFKYFKNAETSTSRFLFFNRNRVTIDYAQTSTTNLPTFGFTEAISYNHPKLKGFAPVIVAQINNKGIYPKAGLQYFYRKKNITFFGWVVAEIKNKPNLDLFALVRYEPKIADKLNLFT